MDRETNYFVILPKDGEVPTKASFHLLEKLLKYEHSLSIKAADLICHPFAFSAWRLVSVAH